MSVGGNFIHLTKTFLECIMNMAFMFAAEKQKRTTMLVLLSSMMEGRKVHK